MPAGTPSRRGGFATWEGRTGASSIADDLLPDRLRTGRDRDVPGPGEHPFPTKDAIRTAALAIEPSIYLETLVCDFALFGGKIVIRKFDTPRDLMSLSESILSLSVVEALQSPNRVWVDREADAPFSLAASLKRLGAVISGLKKW